MYQFLYNCVKSRYGEKIKLCNMDTYSFIVYKKQKIFTYTLQKMLKQDLILQIINYKDHCLEQEIKVPSEK